MEQGDAVAWISRECLIEMQREAASFAPRETGGVLLGYRASATQVVIETLIGPGPRAIHRCTTFVPDYEHHEAMVARAFEETSGHRTYLGDWHSHPRGAAYLSPKDRATLLRIATDPEAQTALPVMAIVANGRPWQLGIWQGRARARSWRSGWMKTLGTVKLSVRPFET